VRLDGILLGTVEMNKITPIYIETISESKQKKLLRILENGRSLSSHIIVEKDSDNNKYWLIAGYPELSAYKKFYQMHGGIEDIPCVIQPFSNQTEQRIVFLSRMFHHQSSTWLDKHVLIHHLLDEGKSASFIANQIGVTEGDIKTYLIHPDIPPEIIERAKKNEGSFITLEKVRKLQLDIHNKHRLFQRAVFIKRHPDRLTTDKLEKIKWLLNRVGFSELGQEDKWEMLQYALNFRNTLGDIWDLEINKRITRDINNKLASQNIPDSFSDNYPNFIQ
jgi:hypothetical protein